jgi:hypothetical protein
MQVRAAEGCEWVAAEVDTLEAVAAMVAVGVKQLETQYFALRRVKD